MGERWSAEVKGRSPGGFDSTYIRDCTLKSLRGGRAEVHVRHTLRFSKDYDDGTATMEFDIQSGRPISGRGFRTGQVDGWSDRGHFATWRHEWSYTVRSIN